jgi:hypothetical protein
MIIPFIILFLILFKSILNIEVNILDINSTSINFQYSINEVTNTYLNYSKIEFYYTINNKSFNLNESNRSIIIDHLIESTKYKIIFILVLKEDLTNRTIRSNDMIEFITNNKCNCKINTTISNGYNEDNCEINKCKCKDCYEGSNCNKCKSNCYLNNQTLECVKCPCDLNKSDGLCLFDQDYDSIRCNLCILPSIGLLCDECDTYYYKSLSNDCLPCTCNSNSNPLARRHCNDLDGD